MEYHYQVSALNAGLPDFQDELDGALASWGPKGYRLISTFMKTEAGRVFILECKVDH